MGRLCRCKISVFHSCFVEDSDLLGRDTVSLHWCSRRF